MRCWDVNFDIKKTKRVEKTKFLALSYFLKVVNLTYKTIGLYKKRVSCCTTKIPVTDTLFLLFSSPGWLKTQEKINLVMDCSVTPRHRDFVEKFAEMEEVVGAVKLIAYKIMVFGFNELYLILCDFVCAFSQTKKSDGLHKGLIIFRTHRSCLFLHIFSDNLRIPRNTLYIKFRKITGVLLLREMSIYI